MPADLNDYFNKKGGGNKSGGSGGGKKPTPPNFLKDFSKRAGLLYLLMGVVVLLVIAKPFVVIESGEVGIKATAGKYEPEPLGPGFHVYIPFIQTVKIVDTKVRSINYTTKPTDNIAFGRESGVRNASAITALDKRGLIISIDITVQYRLRPETAPQTIATYGFAWEEKIINPIVRDVVRSVIGQYKAEELPVKRNEIATQIREGIEEQIEKKKGRPVELTTVNLREIILPPKIVEQIERVQIAKQEADRVKLEVERAKQEAEKKAALAQGDADAKKIRAQGSADAIEIEAHAQAFANTEIGKSLTGELLQLKQIEVQGAFNEALKVNKDSKIFLTPGGAVPSIWIDAKDKQQTTAATSK
ncbi:MAG TPA: prohibitin family protein [Campylobacteraceae bacterium]|nr:prohibitin family protein [Campylobacteraceae bacterium]